MNIHQSGPARGQQLQTGFAGRKTPASAGVVSGVIHKGNVEILTRRRDYTTVLLGLNSLMLISGRAFLMILAPAGFPGCAQPEKLSA